MKTFEIKNGEVIIGVESSCMIASVTPIDGGFWVSIGHPNERGVLLDNDDWKGFVELVKEVDLYLEKNYG